MINTDEEYWIRLRTEVKKALAEHLGQPAIEKDEIGLDEALNELGISASTLYKKVSLKQIPFKKMGPKKLLFSRKELRDWKAANTK